MKDQNQLLKKCLLNDIPAIVFQGTDKCAPDILQAAADIYKKNGCSEEFLYDFNQLINNFKAYQAENINEIKVPALTTPEIEVVKIDRETASPKMPWEIKDLQTKFENYGLTETTEKMSHSKQKTNFQSIIEQYKNEYNKITEIHVFSLESGRMAINCKIGGVLQLPQQLTKEDILSFTDQTNRKNLACKYFGDRASRIAPEEYLNRERNQIVREYATNPSVGISFENLSEYGRYEYEIMFKKYMEQKTDKAVNERILSSGSRTLVADIDHLSGTNPQLTNIRIHDHSTNRVEALETNEIDISKQSSASLEKLLSGNKVEMKDKSGTSSLIGLNKTVTGWGLSVSKQVFSAADASAGI